MSLGVEIGLGLALLTSVASLLGFLLKARRAAEAPAIEWARPVRSSLALFSSGWYAFGILRRRPGPRRGSGVAQREQGRAGASALALSAGLL